MTGTRAIIAAVIPLPLLLFGVGLVALAAAAMIFRSFGPGLRIGRLLAVTPAISVAEAIDAAKSGRTDYVRVEGRIDSDTDFEDEHHRPLVFRRRLLQVQRHGRWETVDEGREAVPFVVRDGLLSVAIDTEALGDGLVVIPREATGTAADARAYLPADIPDATPTRMRIEQVSSVEHAIALGVPVTANDGVAISAGNGRPLVLTTLDVPEAQRLLAGGRRARPVAAAALLATGGGALVAGLAWAALGGIR